MSKHGVCPSCGSDDPIYDEQAQCPDPWHSPVVSHCQWPSPDEGEQEAPNNLGKNDEKSKDGDSDEARLQAALDQAVRERDFREKEQAKAMLHNAQLKARADELSRALDAAVARIRELEDAAKQHVRLWDEGDRHGLVPRFRAALEDRSGNGAKARAALQDREDEG